jgi:hypothetical protein
LRHAEVNDVSPGVIRLNVPWFVTGARLSICIIICVTAVRQEITMGARGMI